MLQGLGQMNMMGTEKEPIMKKKKKKNKFMEALSKFSMKDKMKKGMMK